MTVTQDDVDALTAKARQALLELAGRFHDFGDTAQAMAEQYQPDLDFDQLARLAYDGNPTELLTQHMPEGQDYIQVDADRAIEAIGWCLQAWEDLQAINEAKQGEGQA